MTYLRWYRFHFYCLLTVIVSDEDGWVTDTCSLFILLSCPILAVTLSAWVTRTTKILLFQKAKTSTTTLPWNTVRDRRIVILVQFSSLLLSSFLTLYRYAFRLLIIKTIFRLSCRIYIHTFLELIKNTPVTADPF